MQVTKSGYYEWKKRKPSKRALKKQQLVKEIKIIYKESNGRYGSPKITNKLRENGWNISRPLVARLMQKEGLKSIICKKFRGTTTDSDHDLPVAENLLNRNFNANIPGVKWVSDITYIPTHQGWMYLTIIMDLFDRKIIGWSLSTNLTAQDTVIAALKMAMINRAPVKGQLIFHSDRGIQYACDAFRGFLKRIGAIQSMSRKANCWDNAVAENFFKIVKSELIRHVKFRSILEAKTQLFEFIEIWYNRKRKHSYLGFMTPEQFEDINFEKCA